MAWLEPRVESGSTWSSVSKKDVKKTDKELGKDLYDMFDQKKSYAPDPKPVKRQKKGKCK
jgi:hypothetical protein